MINYNSLRIGDRLIRQKDIIIEHHAIYAGRDYYTNEHLVAENQVNIGVRYITLNQFLDEGKLLRVEYNNNDSYNQRVILQKITERLNKRYHLIDYNCEHFVNDVLNGIKKSKQVQNGVFAILGGISLFALLSSVSQNTAKR